MPVVQLYANFQGLRTFMFFCLLQANNSWSQNQAANEERHSILHKALRALPVSTDVQFDVAEAPCALRARSNLAWVGY